MPYLAFIPLLLILPYISLYLCHCRPLPVYIPSSNSFLSCSPIADFKWRVEHPASNNVVHIDGRDPGFFVGDDTIHHFLDPVPGQNSLAAGQGCVGSRLPNAFAHAIVYGGNDGYGTTQSTQCCLCPSTLKLSTLIMAHSQHRQILFFDKTCKLSTFTRPHLG